MDKPQVLHQPRKVLDFRQYRMRGAQESDYANLITTSTVIYDDEADRVAIVYLELDEACDDIVGALNRIHYEVHGRTGGMRSRSRLFGFKPRIAIRADFCSVTSLAYADPEAHAIVTSYAQKVARYYQEYNPDLYAKHEQLVQKVLPAWKITDSVFTSGIINKNNPLLYHFDAGNFKDVWSNMLVFKHKVTGGYLAVPEYDVGFELKNNSLLMFDGQNLLHGVTPISLLAPDAQRYSIVYYSLQAMWNCEPLDQEIERIRELRTAREYERLDRNQRGEPLRNDQVNASRDKRLHALETPDNRPPE